MKQVYFVEDERLGQVSDVEGRMYLATRDSMPLLTISRILEVHILEAQQSRPLHLSQAVADAVHTEIEGRDT